MGRRTKTQRSSKVKRRVKAVEYGSGHEFEGFDLKRFLGLREGPKRGKNFTNYRRVGKQYVPQRGYYAGRQLTSEEFSNQESVQRNRQRQAFRDYQNRPSVKQYRYDLKSVAGSSPAAQQRYFRNLHSGSNRRVVLKAHDNDVYARYNSNVNRAAVVARYFRRNERGTKKRLPTSFGSPACGASIKDLRKYLRVWGLRTNGNEKELRARCRRAAKSINERRLYRKMAEDFTLKGLQALARVMPGVPVKGSKAAQVAEFRKVGQK